MYCGKTEKVGWSRLWGPESQCLILSHPSPQTTPSISGFNLRIISLSESNIHINIVQYCQLPSSPGVIFDFTTLLSISILMLIIKYLSLLFHSHSHYPGLLTRISLLFLSAIFNIIFFHSSDFTSSVLVFSSWNSSYNGVQRRWRAKEFIKRKTLVKLI